MSDLEMEKRNGKKMREAGHDASGEPSPEALKQWFVWAGIAIGICAAVACILAFVSGGQNRKAAVIMEAEVDELLTLTLNRKGAVLEISEEKKGIWENAETETLKKDSLEEACRGILEILADRGALGDDSAVLFTVRAADENCHVDMNGMAENIGVYTETFLKKKQAKGTVYVGAVRESEEIREISGKYRCSMGKAALVKDLTDKNTRVKTSEQVRLCGLSIDRMHEEMIKSKYTTSFIVVTSGKVYQVKTEEAAAPEKNTDGAQESMEDGTEESTQESVQTPESTAEPESETESLTAEIKVQEPETQETGTSETRAPETLAPETIAPETSAPETKAPETSAPETKAPETTAAAPAPVSPAETAPALQETRTLTPAAEEETRTPVVQSPVDPAPEAPTTEAATEAQPGMPKHVGPGYVEEVVPVRQ